MTGFEEVFQSEGEYVQMVDTPNDVKSWQRCKVEEEKEEEEEDFKSGRRGCCPE